MVTFCDFDRKRRCKNCVKYSPSLKAFRYRDSIVLFKDCTKKRFKSITFYRPGLKASAYGETVFLSPVLMQTSYVAYKDYHGNDKRKWFTNTVVLKPRIFSSTTLIHFDNSHLSNNNNSKDDFKSRDDSLIDIQSRDENVIASMTSLNGEAYAETGYSSGEDFSDISV